MKKLSLLLLFILIVFTFSCSDDDETVIPPSIVGKWEFLREGEIINGPEVLTPYLHDCPNNKDYILFNENNSVASHYHEQIFNCVSNVTSGSWSKNGNNITIIFSGESNNAQILNLDATTLKVRITNTGGNDEVTEFVRR